MTSSPKKLAKKSNQKPIHQKNKPNKKQHRSLNNSWNRILSRMAASLPNLFKRIRKSLLKTRSLPKMLRNSHLQNLSRSTNLLSQFRSKHLQNLPRNKSYKIQRINSRKVLKRVVRQNLRKRLKIRQNLCKKMTWRVALKILKVDQFTANNPQSRVKNLKSSQRL